ncbi:MAG: hypothetical protein HZA51_18825 [Planctomycetes bacterium]|nr:hypothetical protein [Planctomycetota bacterium]
MQPQTLKTRGLHVGVRFAPPAILDKQHKQDFQLKCGDGFDWRRQEYQDTAWHLVSPQSEGDPRSQLKLSLQPDVVNFEDYFPTAPLEVYTDNLRLVLKTVADVFNPRIILGTGVVIRLTAQSDGNDARVFLGQRCLRLDDRLAVLGRPVHAVGLKFLLPPLPGEDMPNWQAEIKIESLIEDVRQLFIEVDARWANPMGWDVDSVVDRLKTAHAFATGPVIQMIQGMGRES